ncbi:dTDP-4-dehydrorhamnose 3,5-epimerase family protein [Candidatus Pacearchaeota archaeon]|nr:dTDP-4-dehydrorhamnose 3,5-epimerase family protein [Candidatus Pacearchaeota archaeon]
MKILEIKNLEIPDIKVIKFARFCDERGYFTEQFRKSDLFNRSELNSMKGINFVQANQSYSKKGTIRGMHFQWNPYMGKMVRTLSGHMVDLILDIRKGSPNYGKMIAYEMQESDVKEYDEWKKIK